LKVNLLRNSKDSALREVKYYSNFCQASNELNVKEFP